jgi:hypothetical protein
MSAQLLRLPRRLELEHYVTLALRKVDRQARTITRGATKKPQEGH